uniref:Translation initiation factor eIF2B subunit beta n=1 Tax=Panagrolaimus superbus TaxID=310955 RepID=A0A914YRB6_9BILA
MASAIAEQSNLEKLRNEINLYFHKMSSRDSTGKLALRILKYFSDIVTYAKYKTVDELIAILMSDGELLYSAHSSEFLIRNMLLSVLKIIREESLRQTSGMDETFTQTDSLNRLWFLPSDVNAATDIKKIKGGILVSLGEYQMEMENSVESLASKALQEFLISEYSDIVMTYKFSKSETLKKFFSNVKTKILYSVDDDPDAQANVISSIDILSTMRTTTRVIISAAAILPDGSCVSTAGTLSMCLAAKRHSVPVLVCASFYKLTPMFIPHLDEFNVHSSPVEILPASEALKFSNNVFIANPLFDRIPSNLITLFITPTAVVSPSHVYRLIAECYHPEDFRQLHR